MNFTEVLNSRRSIRRFKQDKIEDVVLLSLIDAATKAPSAGNTQPLRYFIIREKGLLAEIFAQTAWGGHVRPARDPQLGVTSPTAFIAVCTQNQGESASGCADAGAAIQNILLAATDLGLGSCWIGAFNKAKVNELLKLDKLTAVYLVALGYPAEAPVMERIHKGESTKYSLDENDVIHVPKYAPGDVAEFL